MTGNLSALIAAVLSRGQRTNLALLCEVKDLRLDVANLTNVVHRLEEKIMAIREEFNEGLADLAVAVTEVTDFIEGIQEDDVKPEDVAKLKSLATRLRAVAVAAPEVPVEGTPVEGGQTGNGEANEEV